MVGLGRRKDFCPFRNPHQRGRGEDSGDWVNLELRYSLYRKKYVYWFYNFMYDVKKRGFYAYEH